MKPLPRYWAVHHEVANLASGKRPLSALGSSDLSQEQAERDARERFQALVAAGGPRPSGAGGEYYPDRRRPEELLEEIHSPSGELIAVITRNRYGAAVLNTDAVLIADIDIPGDPARDAPVKPAGRGFFARLLGRDQGNNALDSSSDGGDPDLVGLPGSGRRGEEHQRILGRIGQFCADHPRFGVHTYRTRNGFRLLVTGTGAAPDSEQAHDLLAQLGSDELYTLLCRVHDTYRARLTPKPWRVGVRAPRAPGLGLPHGRGHQKWVEDYRAASSEVAVCRFIGSAGPAPDTLERQLIDLHDRAVRHDSGLRLA